MERPDELQDIIDHYLLGRLTPAEQEVLNAALANDPSLAAELALETEAVKAIDAFGDQQLKASLQQVEAQLVATAAAGRPLAAAPVDQPIAKTAKVIPFYRKNVLAVAAAILLLLAAGWFILRSGGSEFNAPAAYAANFEPYRNIAVQLTRGAETPTPEELAYTAYENGKWAAAEQLIDELPASEVNSFYLAQTYLKQGKFSEAVALLEILRKNDGFALHYATEWYLAMAYLGQGETTKALPLLKQISTTQGHPFAQQAEKLSNW